MGNFIENNRNGCLLQGSISTLKAINGVVPIIHSTAGCGVQEKYIANTTNGRNDNYTTSSTNVIEKQVIFGGTSRLREQIKNTVKVLEGGLYVVVSGCSTEIVGDDIAAMTKESYEQGYPVIYVSTPGFKADSFQAYKYVTIGILEGLTKLDQQERPKENSLVNVFGIVPSIDPYWEGNLQEINGILDKVGLEYNSLLGRNSSVENWKRIKAAGLNIAYTKYGKDIAEYLKKKYGTPYLYFEHLPVGIDGVTELLSQLSTIYEQRKDYIESVEKEEKEHYLYYLSKLAPYYYRNHIQKEVALVGASPMVVSLGIFLEQRFGQKIQTIIVTDGLQQEEKNLLEKNFSHGSRFYYTEDGKEINDILKTEKPEIILGSQLEEAVAEELNIPIIYSFLPVEGQVILNQSVFGVNGILNFVTEFSNAVGRQ